MTQPTITSWQPNHLEWQLSCVDYTFLADNIIVFGTFYNQSADQIIKTLVAQANVGLTTNNVQAGPAIPVVQINYLTLSEALTKVARLASITTDFSWYIDYSKDIHFFSLNQTVVSQVTLSDSDFPGASGTTGNYEVDSFGYEWDGGSIRNSCIVRGTNYRTTSKDTFVGNGSQTSFPISFNVSTDVTPRVTVGGVSKTLSVITQNSQVAAASTQWQIVQNPSGSWFLQVGTDPAPATNVAVVVSYTSQAPIITRVDNQLSQSQLGVTAQMYVADSSLVNLGSAAQRGQAELQEYQWPQERVSLTTNENFTGHIEAGNVIILKASRIPDSQNSYQQGINGKFLIVQNNYAGTQGNYRKYTITGTRVQ